MNGPAAGGSKLPKTKQECTMQQQRYQRLRSVGRQRIAPTPWERDSEDTVWEFVMPNDVEESCTDEDDTDDHDKCDTVADVSTLPHPMTSLAVGLVQFWLSAWIIAVATIRRQLTSWRLLRARDPALGCPLRPVRTASDILPGFEGIKDDEDDTSDTDSWPDSADDSEWVPITIM